MVKPKMEFVAHFFSLFTINLSLICFFAFFFNFTTGIPDNMPSNDYQQNLVNGIDIENDGDFTGSDQETNENDRNEMSRPRKIRR